MSVIKIKTIERVLVNSKSVHKVRLQSTVTLAAKDAAHVDFDDSVATLFSGADVQEAINSTETLLKPRIIPEGGGEGQVLAKASGDDYDTEWQTPSGGGGQEPLFTYSFDENPQTEAGPVLIDNVFEAGKDYYIKLLGLVGSEAGAQAFVRFRLVDKDGNVITSGYDTSRVNLQIGSTLASVSSTNTTSVLAASDVIRDTGTLYGLVQLFQPRTSTITRVSAKYWSQFTTTFVTSYPNSVFAFLQEAQEQSQRGFSILNAGNKPVIGGKIEVYEGVNDAAFL